MLIVRLMYVNEDPLGMNRVHSRLNLTWKTRIHVEASPGDVADAGAWIRGLVWQLAVWALAQKAVGEETWKQGGLGP